MTEETEEQMSQAEEDMQFGKYGKIGHFNLVKRALIHGINRYYDQAVIIQIEKETIKMGASLYMHDNDVFDVTGRDMEKNYTLHPDICLIVKKPSTFKSLGVGEGSLIIIECETTATNLLTNELRLVAYKMLRLRHPDKQKFRMYLAMPIELKGKVKKPDMFNDIWWFDMNSSMVIPVEEEGSE